MAKEQTKQVKININIYYLPSSRMYTKFKDPGPYRNLEICYKKVCKKKRNQGTMATKLTWIYSNSLIES